MHSGDHITERATAGEDDSPLMAAISARDRDTLAMVRRALREHDVALAYQPVMRANGSPQPAFYEGLIRVLDETGRIIPAREFIGTVETTEMGRMIDCLALEMGLAALADTPALRLSINMSARSIGYPRWMQTLNHGLSQDGTVAERLILEITESSAMLMPDLVTVFMKDLQYRGISFALDDFGAGYTAFRYLRDFYFDILKIDGQFIRGIGTNPDNQILASALISIARHFDMFTIAESVENAQDATFLQDSGIDCMQGYFFGAPSLNPPWRNGAKQKKTA